MLNFMGKLLNGLTATLVEWRQRQRAYAELSSLDDRSLADIGIHRSQISGLVETAGASANIVSDPDPDPVVASALGFGGGRLAGGRPWLPPI